MSGGLFVFSNARVKAKEKSLLTITQLNRLIESQTIGDAFKLLIEFGFGAGTSFEQADFDRLFAYEEENATSILRELDVKDSGINAFLKKNDYHNLKVTYKARELEQLGSKEDIAKVVFAPQGNISTEFLCDTLTSKDYRRLSDNMRKVVSKLDTIKVAGKLTPHTIDVEIDKAMYEDIVSTLKIVKRQELTNYFVQSIDIANISAFIRAKKLDLPLKFFENGFIEGGDLNYSFYESQFEQPIEMFKERTKFNRYASLVAVAVEENGLTKFEVDCDNMLLNIFKKEKNDMFSASPIVGFYLGKLTELKAVKLVVAAMKNGVDSQVMKQRMRELYA